MPGGERAPKNIKLTTSKRTGCSRSSYGGCDRKCAGIAGTGSDVSKSRSKAGSGKIDVRFENRLL